ncbi:MAG: hypothetical protein OHK0012_17400 [Synechococcales cyanobacterium]
MNRSVIVVLVFNGLVFCVCLWLLPFFWGLSRVLANTAHSFQDWQQGAAAGLHPLPTALLGLRGSLQKSRQQLTQTQQKSAWLKGIWFIFRRVRRRVQSQHHLRP